MSLFIGVITTSMVRAPPLGFPAPLLHQDRSG
jgi:hypothetical protein